MPSPGHRGGGDELLHGEGFQHSQQRGGGQRAGPARHPGLGELLLYKENMKEGETGFRTKFKILVDQRKIPTIIH